MSSLAVIYERNCKIIVQCYYHEQWTDFVCRQSIKLVPVQKTVELDSEAKIIALQTCNFKISRSLINKRIGYEQYHENKSSPSIIILWQ
eukprot:c19565_g1_i1 orf=767-1033(+)